MRFRWLFLLFLSLETYAARGQQVDDAVVPAFDAAELEFFEKEVRPLLVRRCYACHSEKSDKIGGGLRLDSRSAALTGGDTGPAVVPRQPEASLLIDAVNYGDVYQMPPKSKLPAQEIQTLAKWVALGAPWPAEAQEASSRSRAFDLAARKADHWCWQPIGDPLPPAVQQVDWPRQTLDKFILAKLEAEGLQPAAAADKRTLLRRASFDLTGLPPTVAEVEAFLSDTSPMAFERVVDRLLKSPHFAERWARHWLDLVRYAETYGHEFDFPIPHAYKYRDYVIRAFDDDVPYDRFVMEHVAGDLLTPPRPHPTEGYNEAVLGTGFWWLGEATHAPVDVLGDEAGRTENQVDVFGKTFLGLTIACARCHDHKFDAISTKDFYALAGFLQSSRRDEAVLDSHGNIATAVRQLESWQQQGSDLLGQALTQTELTAEQFARYLLAAREAMFGEPSSADSPTQVDDVIFEDFEKPTYESWTVVGMAFGDGPQSRETTPGYQGDLAARGQRWVNSHNTRDRGDVARGDHHVGRLTSRSFVIQQRYIQFLVGGGNHAGKTCVNLVVKGEVVRSQTGFNENRMRPAQFDVSDLQGQEGRIEIVDDATGGWGNIGVDHIVFSNGTMNTRRPVHEVAAEFDVDAQNLERWITALAQEDIQDTAHPLHAWRVLAEAPAPAKFAELRTRLEGERAEAAEFEQRYPLLTDFKDWDDWFVTGSAFGDRTIQAGRWDPHSAAARWLVPGRANSGLLSHRLHGTLRSPTFALEHPYIHYRIKGQGAKVRLVIDGYFMNSYSELLFRGFSFDVQSPDRFVWQQHSQDIGRYLGHRGYIEILDTGDGFVEIDEIRFSTKATPPTRLSPIAGEVVSADVDSLESLAAAYGRLWNMSVSPEDVASRVASHVELLNWVSENRLWQLPTGIEQSITRLRQSMQGLAIPSPVTALALTEGTAENHPIYIRGNHRILGPEAPRHLLEALVGTAISEDSGSGRLRLAQQLVDPSNPLTARVMVNRVWHHLLGRGIVASTDNLGVLGQPLTHPELLDHLATEFMREGWSIKRLIKRIMLSSTYQMSSQPSEEGNRLDPQNLWLHRAHVRRLQGEAIRDSILAISGRLDRTLYGPSVPVHITPFMQGRGRPKDSGPLDGAGRRSLYLEVRRNFLSPMMLAFDTPIPFNSVGTRNVSNVPAQALILMNDPFVVEQARLWAQQVMATAATGETRVNQMYLEAFARPPSEQERAAALDFVQQQARELGLTEAQLIDDVSVWADVGHVLMNVKEFVFLN